jgi:predicted ABC-type ATPase
LFWLREFAGDQPLQSHVVVLAGPNGAGKTTAAPRLLRDRLRVRQFVNADTLALGLSGFDAESAAIAAGRIMLQRLHELAAEHGGFAFETTLASRSFAPWLKSLVDSAYAIHLVFLWLPSADAAVNRVAQRVRLGGHDVPEATIRRRYVAGLRNFFTLYRPIATTWRMYDNSRESGLRFIAAGKESRTTRVSAKELWKQLTETYES